ncbi:MAG: hypothetical protein Q7T63_17055 [Burkholderiaceae bacterium]|nr:hypothetical protein [Burkholderiaceae bacterium]MDP3139467.1 hypothetical protein [Burkholderiaceae bacterium]
MRVFNLLGALLFHSIHGVVKLGLFVLNKSLDAVYGKPEIARVAPVAYKVKQGTASEPLRDFPPTVQVAVTGTGPTADAAKAPTNSALEPSDVKPRPRAHLATADRVRTAQLCGPHGIVLGMMWLYLYPEQGIARRVFKVTDPQLIRAFNKDRFYFADVPYEPATGSKALLDKLHTECSVLLGRRRIDDREKRQSNARAPRAGSASAVVAAPAPAAKPDVRAVQPAAVAPAVAPTQAPAPAEASAVAPAARRRVSGDVYKGIVTVAGPTRRGTGKDSYETFCLTINDGVREIPLFGNELQRQAADLNIQQGEKVKVVFMGKQQTTVPGSNRPSYKNLYQLTRLEGS